MTGKGVQAIMEIKPGKWQTNFLGETVEASGEEELVRLEQRVRSAGFYPSRMSPDAFAEFANSAEVQERVFEESMAATIQGWLEFAETKLKGTGRRIIVTAGNDDPLFINELFTGCRWSIMAERQVLQFDEHHEMINEGYSNPTPWHTHREMDEESLYKVIEAQAEQVKDMKNAIFNLHVPPYNSKLDDAPLLDKNLVPIDGGRTYGPVGSKAVRKAIENISAASGAARARARSQGAGQYWANPVPESGQHVHRGRSVRLFGHPRKGRRPRLSADPRLIRPAYAGIVTRS